MDGELIRVDRQADQCAIIRHMKVAIIDRSGVSQEWPDQEIWYWGQHVCDHQHGNPGFFGHKRSFFRLHVSVGKVDLAGSYVSGV